MLRIVLESPPRQTRASQWSTSRSPAEACLYAPRSGPVPSKAPTCSDAGIAWVPRSLQRPGKAVAASSRDSSYTELRLGLTSGVRFGSVGNTLIVLRRNFSSTL